MRRSFGLRLMLWFGGASTLVLGIAMVVTYLISCRQALHELDVSAQAVEQNFSARFEENFEHAETVAGMLALDGELRPGDPPQGYRVYLEKLLQRNPDIYGACMAWVPGRHPSGRSLQAPYCYRDSQGFHFVQLGTAVYDYPSRPWFRRAAESGKPGWSEAYLDEGGGEKLMLTYSAPFLGPTGKVEGVATADVTLDSLQAEARRLRVGEKGYAFVVDGKGRFLAFPDSRRVMSDGLARTNADLLRLMGQSPRGTLRGADPLDGGACWMIYQRLQSPDLALVMAFPEGEVLADVTFLQKTLLITGLGYYVVLLVLVALIARSMSRPVELVTAMARRIAEGDLNTTMPALDTRDEMAELAHVFNKMVADIRIMITRIQASTREHERMHRELQIASEIQLSFLAREFPPWPDRDEFEIYARCLQAAQVGGDFYDFFLVDDDTLAFALGDTAGKGVPAALFLAVCRTLLRAYAFHHRSPARCLEEVNLRLCDENDPAMFVTAIYGLLDLRQGTVTLCNAGHPSPYLLRAVGEAEELALQGNRPLGIRPGAYHECHLTLGEGDRLFMFSDGVTEAEDGHDQFFGTARVRQWLEGRPGRTAQELVETAFRVVQRFAGGAPQSDDITVLALRFCHASSPRDADIVESPPEGAETHQAPPSTEAKAGG